MSRHHVRADAQAGFTLAEYVAAVAILLTVVIGAISALTYAATAGAATARRDEATTIANRVLEEARNQGYDALSTWQPDVSAQEAAGYTVETLVSWARDEDNRATSRIVHVTVSWEQPRHGSIEMETRIFGLSDVANTGDVLVNVVEALSGGSTKPLAGASVTVTPSVGSVQKVITDAEGGAFFGHVGAGTFQFFAKKTGYIVDHSAYGTNPTVVAGSTTTCQVTAYRSSSHQFNFTCDTGSPSGMDVTITGAKANPLMTKTTSGSTITFDNLLPDSYAIALTLPTGYTVDGTVPVNFSITEGDTHSSTTINLVKSTVLVVTVTDDRGSGYPVSNATVSLSGAGSASATTNSSGQATFVISKSGTYAITAAATGYVSASTNRTVTLGTDASAGLTLARYGTLSCTYSSYTNTTLYVYDADHNLVASGKTSSRKVSFDLPPANYYYVSRYSYWRSSAAQSDAVVSGQTTSVSVSTSN